MANVKSSGKLDNLEPILENKANLGLFESGNMLAVRASELAPVLSGLLRNSIQSTDVTRQETNVYSCRIGSNVVYANFQEKENPYLTPAFYELRLNILENLKSQIISGLTND